MANHIPRKNRKETHMLNLKVCTWSLASFTAVSYLLCIVWGLVTPGVLHMHGFLETVLPGFHWLTAGSFFVGLIESFLWGAYVGLVFVPVHNFFHRKWS
jgi:hypothetical protein